MRITADKAVTNLKRIDNKNKQLHMLIIKKGERDSIDKVLKQYKRKVRETQLLKEIRSRKEFTKPSAIKRKQKLKAIYQQKINKKF
jgi:small subunit ribosomal protein S21